MPKDQHDPCVVSLHVQVTDADYEAMVRALGPRATASRSANIATWVSEALGDSMKAITEQFYVRLHEALESLREDDRRGRLRLL